MDLVIPFCDRTIDYKEETRAFLKGHVWSWFRQDSWGMSLTGVARAGQALYGSLY